MAKNPNITQAQLRSILDYDPKSGVFTWRKRTAINRFAGGMLLSDQYRRRWNTRYAGKVAGTRHSRGYWSICLTDTSGKRPYLAHRLAWFYVYGVWPDAELDHINRDKLDNRIENLRAATRSQNQANNHAQRNNKVGMRGVMASYNGKFMARIRKHGRVVHLGAFLTVEEAKAAYDEAAERIHGEFARFK